MATTKDQIEQLKQDNSELEDAHRERGGDSGTIDTRKNAKTLMELQSQIKELQKAVKNAPVAWGDEHRVNGEDDKHRSGKYAGEENTTLALTQFLMEEGHRLSPRFMSAPSDEITKVLSATGIGTGAEYVPTLTEGSLWEDVHLASLVAGNLPNLPMPSDPFDIPISWGATTWRKGVESTGTNATDKATDKKTMTATEQIAEVQFSYNLDEDAIVAIMPSLRSDLVREGAEQIDKFLMRADATAAATGNINSDDATPASQAYFLTDGKDGIIHQWLIDNSAMAVDAGGDAPTLTDITNARRLMGKYGIKPTDVKIFAEPVTYLTMLNISEVTTVEKYGPGATVLTGELAKIGGIPIVVTEAQYQAEADGKQSATAGNNTLGTLSFVNSTQWRVGFRRELLLEVAQDIQNRKWILVASVRLAIVNRGTRSSNIHTAGVRNILIT